MGREFSILWSEQFLFQFDKKDRKSKLKKEL